MNRKETQKVYELILKLAAYYKYKCEVCEDICTTGKYFTIHHIKYKKNEKTYKDFKDKKTRQYMRLKYYRYLTPIVKKNPKRFSLVCNSCHQAVTKLARWKKEKRKRLIRLVNKSD